MTPELVTIIGGVAVAILTSIVAPILIRRRQVKMDEASAGLASWQGLTNALQKERDDLKLRVDKIERAHEERIRAMEADHARQMKVAEDRISALEKELSKLYRRLYGSDDRPSRPDGL